MKKTQVTLREERTKGDYRFLGAELKENGDLVIEGQDLGNGVKCAFGCVEYEWCWTIKANDIPLFKKAIGSEKEILEILETYFSREKASGLYEFMQNNKIPFDSWSRIGD